MLGNLSRAMQRPPVFGRIAQRFVFFAANLLTYCATVVDSYQTSHTVWSALARFADEVCIFRTHRTLVGIWLRSGFHDPSVFATCRMEGDCPLSEITLRLLIAQTVFVCKDDVDRFGMSIELCLLRLS